MVPSEQLSVPRFQYRVLGICLELPDPGLDQLAEDLALQVFVVALHIIKRVNPG